jgi:cytochrome c biogenesis DsbD-like protein
MLGSINPLGERARHSRWWVTVSVFLLGSTVAGLGLGWLLGFAGEATVSTVAVAGRLAALAVLAALGLVLDLRLFGSALPTLHRQVNEDWLTVYRGWVYGIGFGFQLGLGLVTVVAISAVYVTFAAAFLSGSAVAGAAIGGAFGLLRALPALTVVGVRSGSRLGEVDSWLRRWDRPSLRVAVALEAVLAVAAMVAVAA